MAIGYFHNEGMGACGGVAFIMNYAPSSGDMVKAEHVEYPPAENGKPIICMSCGKPVMQGTSLSVSDIGETQWPSDQ